MAEAGDWVRLRCIPTIMREPLPEGSLGFKTPCWGMVVEDNRGTGANFDYEVRVLASDVGRWGVFESTIIPENEITDAEWAELAAERLTHG